MYRIILNFLLSFATLNKVAVSKVTLQKSTQFAHSDIKKTLPNDSVRNYHHGK